MKRMLINALAVGGAGFFGALARYALAALLDSQAMWWGTLLINVAGSFLIGWALTLVGMKVAWMSDTMRLALVVGFLGAFTTFSSYMWQTHSALQDGAWIKGMLYLFGSLALGLLAVQAGIAVARHT